MRVEPVPALEGHVAVPGDKSISHRAVLVGAICEGVDHILGYRSPNYVYKPPHTGMGAHGKPFGLLLKTTI